MPPQSEVGLESLFRLNGHPRRRHLEEWVPRKDDNSTTLLSVTQMFYIVQIMCEEREDDSQLHRGIWPPEMYVLV